MEDTDRLPAVRVTDTETAQSGASANMFGEMSVLSIGLLKSRRDLSRVMERRDLLATVGAGVSALGGCLGSGGLSPAQTRSTAETPATDTETPAFDPDGRVGTIRIGKNPGEIVPHGVVVWNALGSSRPVYIQVFDVAAGETRHEKTHDLPADVAIVIELRAPSRYRITFRVSAVDVQRTISIPDRLFDTCNESYTHVSIRKNGLTDRTMTTELECTTATG